MSAKKLSLEDVVSIEGKVVLRPDDAQNKNSKTGMIDIEALITYNKSKRLHLILMIETQLWKITD